MTNRNRKKIRQDENKHKQAAVKAAVKMQEGKPGSNWRGKMITTEKLNFIIALIALVVSIISIWSQNYYAEKGYHYKLDPEIEPQGYMDTQIQKYEDGYRVAADFTTLEFKILQKNNLQAAYLIHADNEVEKLEIGDIEDILPTKLGAQAELDGADIVYGGISYNYKFLFLKDLDGTYELSLFYIKADNELIGFNQASGIEIWELERAHPNDEKYYGEKQMAKQYAEILEGCEKYMIQ